MAEAGILGEDDRLELIEGEIVEMTPIGPSHSGTVNRLTRLFTSRLGERVVVAVQNPVRMPPRSEPQPDVVLLNARDDFYSSSHPVPADVLLLVEVAQSSAGFDRGVKMPLYARHGIREYWLVDLDQGHVEVYRRPGHDGYEDRTVFGSGTSIGAEALPDESFSIDEILGT
jgi:Uma2 family endonuclease